MVKKKIIEPKQIFFCGVVGGILIGLVIGAIIISGYTLTEKCDTLINESFTNGTIAGWQLGVYQTSQLVIINNTLPVFVDGTIKFIDLNLKEVK